MYVIVAGDAFNGLTLYGPWEFMEDAHEWAENTQDHWDCVKLATPSGAYHKALFIGGEKVSND